MGAFTGVSSTSSGYSPYVDEHTSNFSINPTYPFGYPGASMLFLPYQNSFKPAYAQAG